MDRKIDLTRVTKVSQKLKRAVIVDNPIIADEVMVDKVHQFSEDKYDQIKKTLNENPFLPNDELASEFEVVSIDEYYFDYKNKTMNLRSVVTNNNYSNHQKRKVIRYVFKNWIKDYQKLERDQTISIKEQLKLLENVKYKRFSILLVLLFTIVLIVNFLLFFSNNSLVYFPFLSKATEAVTNSGALEALSVLVISINFLIVTFGIYHNKVLRNYQRDYLMSKQNVNELYSNMKRAFMSKAKKAKRYCLRAYKKKNYKPYPIKKIDLEEYSIDNVQKYAQVATIHTATLKNISQRFNICRHLLLWSGSGIIIGYYIYLLIMIFI